MQNTQNIVWWLEVLRIGIPSFVALVVPFIAGYLLLKRTENYKKELSKEIEDYKTNLQSQFYQYQTKYSAFHQREAEAVESIYISLIDLGKSIKSAFSLLGSEDQEKELEEATSKYFEFLDIYQKKQIYFNAELSRDIEEIQRLASDMISKSKTANLYRKETNNTSKMFAQNKDLARLQEYEAFEIFDVKFPDLQTNLRNKFRRLLSAENFEIAKSRN